MESASKKQGVAGPRAELRARVKGLLWGMVVADALAMPAHWYYNIEDLRRDLGQIRGYVAPKSPHPQSMISVGGMRYFCNPENPINIWHQNRRFFSLSEEKGYVDGFTDSSDGKPIEAREESRLHYHAGLVAGENTTGPDSLIRTLLRDMVENSRYDRVSYLQKWKAFYTTPGAHNDTYLDKYARLFFERLSYGHPLLEAAEEQKEVWSVASHPSLFGVMVLACAAFAQSVSVDEAVHLCIAHHSLTHRGPSIERVVKVLVPLLYALLEGKQCLQAVQQAASQTHLPVITGQQLLEKYMEYKGPDNIPKDETFRLHTTYQDQPFDVLAAVASYTEDAKFCSAEGQVGSFCYVEHGFPACLFFAAKYPSYEDAVLASIHVGGDNCGRSTVLGGMVGAAVGFEGIPQRFVGGLKNCSSFSGEVESFLDLILSDTHVFTTS